MANEFEIDVPYDLEPGVYANAARIWQTRSEFVFDFVARPANEETPDLARLVSRVKFPTIFLFQLIRDLNTTMTEYEDEYGEIARHERDGDEGGKTP